VVSTLSRLLQYNPVAREHCIATSTEWKKGTLWKQQAEVIADVTDGNNCRFHPHLMRPATDLESRDIRIGIGFYGDGIEVRDLHHHTFFTAGARIAAMQSCGPVTRQEQDNELVLSCLQLAGTDPRCDAHAAVVYHKHC